MALPKIRKQIESRIQDVGDTMAGFLTLSGNPTSDLHAATKQYVDNKVPSLAETANKLASAKTISLTGDVSGSGSFDGSNNLSITATVADNSHNHSNYLLTSGGTMTGPLTMANTSGGIIADFKGNADNPFITLLEYPGYGIRYHEGSPDKMTFSASGNASTPSSADLCINGNGEGTVTIRGNTILHAGNYTSYTVTKTGSGASGTWGINISGNAATLSYFKSLSNTAENIDTVTHNLIGYCNPYSTHGYQLFNQSDGTLIRQCYSSNWANEIFMDYRTGQMARRSKNNGTWTGWKALWDEYNSNPCKISSSTPGTNYLWAW